jgi:hypothetical protein
VRLEVLTQYKAASGARISAPVDREKPRPLAAAFVYNPTLPPTAGNDSRESAGYVEEDGWTRTG